MSSHRKAPAVASSTRRAIHRSPKLALLLALALTATIALGATLANAIAPTVTIDPAEGVGYQSAQVKGEVDPQAQFSEWRFQYISDALFEDNIANTLPGFEGATDGPVGGTETAEAVSGELSGLAPGTTYHLRLLATNADGSESAVAPNFQTEAVNPPQAHDVEVSAVTSDSAHFKGIVNSGGAGPGEEAGTYRFQCEPECPGLEGERPIPGAGSDEEVSDDASGLQPNTAYTVKLIARNPQSDAEGVPVEASAPGPFTTDAVAPIAATGTNTPEGQGKVLLRGYVNPRNAGLTSCEFLYGPTESYGQSALCEGEPEGNQPDLVTAKLSGLDPGAIYHLQVVAESAGGTDESADSAFVAPSSAAQPQACVNEARRVEQGSTALPDCRAYEMVSPVDKNGADVVSAAGSVSVADSGEAVAFASLGGFGDARGVSIGAQYISRRDRTPGTSGWRTHSISPRQDGLSLQAAGNGKDTAYRGDFSADLSAGVLHSLTPQTEGTEISNVANVSNFYLRTDLLSPGPGTYQLVSACPDCSEPLADPLGLYMPAFVGASSDYSHVVFEASRNLTGEAPPQGPFCDPAFKYFGCEPRLYEWDHGTVRLAGVLPDGSPAPRSIAGRGFVGKRFTTNLISEDGSRVFFTAPESSFDSGGAQYMRVDHASTVQLNASERTDCSGDPSCGGDSVPDPAPDSSGVQPAFYETASQDGERVFFSSDEQLTDTSGSGLYMYDASKPDSDPHNLTLLSVSGSEEGGIFQGVLGASPDGQYVYFVALGQLLAGQPLLHNSFGLYVWHDSTLRFIGATDGSIGIDGVLGLSWQLAALTSRVSGDGKHLLFASKDGRGLTGYDHGHSCGNGHASACTELYFYSADSDRLECVSCNPSGAPGTANATSTNLSGFGSFSVPIRLNRPVASDGSGVFFETRDRLVPEDNNGRASDVYEYEATTGALHLLSSGRSPDDSHFLEAASDGRNVLFTTTQRLLGWDMDNSYDLYDARVAGGFSESFTAPSECAGEPCRGAYQGGQPQLASPGSAALSSIRNRAKPRQPRKARHRKHRGGKKGHRFAQAKRRANDTTAEVLK